MVTYGRPSRWLTMVGVAALCAAAMTVVQPATSAEAAGGKSHPTCRGKRATIVGTKRADRLVGTKKDDVIVGLGGDDVIKGRGGADIICGGKGDDRIFGGKDRFDPDVDDPETVGDWIDAGPGDDLIVPGFDPREWWREPDRISFARAKRGVVVDLAAGTAKGQGRDTIRLAANRKIEHDVTPAVLIEGSRFADRVLGSERPEGVVAGPGADVVDLAEGRNHVREDRYSASSWVRRTAWKGRASGADEYRTGGAADELQLTEGADRVDTGAGDDIVHAGKKTQGSVRTGDGDDRVYLAEGAAASADLGAGDDDIHLDETWGGAIDLGAGQDVVDAQTFAAMSVDLTGGGFLIGGQPRPLPTGGERWNLRAYQRDVTFTGTDAAETVDLMARTATVATGGGDDRIRLDVGNIAGSSVDGGAGEDAMYWPWTGADSDTAAAVTTGVESRLTSWTSPR